MSGCASCSTANGKAAAGCRNNGGCSSGGCNKMNVFDWLSHMDLPAVDKFDVVEVRFKGGRKEFFRNSNQLDLVTGDAVIVDVPNGHHLGHVSMQGELVRLQMKKKKVEDDENIRSIYRLATLKDLEKEKEVQKRELPTLYRTREIIEELKLNMKLSDVEFQADGTKATFFYSADERVDFRELIKILASEFRIRVEMRQISLRQEAGRLGGIGSCGRELCCATWLSDFKSVSTTAARYQNLSLNPSKLSGQCGRLKCCLNYELETYMEALQEIPNLQGPLLTSKGEAKLQKTDIFRKIMWFGYSDENTWHPLEVERVREIMALNEKGIKPDTLLSDELELPEGAGGALNTDLERLDKKFENKSKKKRKKRKKKKKPTATATLQTPQGQPKTKEPKKAEKSQGAKPQAERPPRGGKPRGERLQGEQPQGQKGGGKPQGERPQGGKPQGDKPQGGKPQGGKPPRKRRKPQGPSSGGNEGNGGNGGNGKSQRPQGSSKPRRRKK
jgi:cell fate regulator YaaT (PSP1 superfamily)